MNHSVSSFCTAVEIKDRCILTAAHCKFWEFPYVYKYRQHWYSRFTDRVEHNEELILQGNVISQMRTKTHPGYYEGDGHDLAIAWMKPWGCKLEGSDNCDIDDPNAETARWNPRGMFFEKLKNDTTLYHVGYGRDEDEKFGIKKSSHSKLFGYGFWDYSSNWYQSGEYQTDSTKYDQYLKAGDSGSPWFFGTEVVAIQRGGAVEYSDYGTPLFTTTNEEFASVGFVTHANEYGEAAKFCRKKPSLETLVAIKGDNYSDDFLVHTPHLPAGHVDVSLTDPLGEYEDESFTCGDDKNPDSKCSHDVVIKGTLTAVANKGYRFVAWAGLYGIAADYCPHAGSSEPSIEVDANSANWTQERYGIKCIAIFERVIEKGDCDGMSPSGIECATVLDF